MSKPKKPRPTAPASQPASADNQINRNLRWFIRVCFVIAAAWLLLSFFYVVRTEDSPRTIEFKDAKIAVALTHPTYATFRDDLDLTLNVTNLGPEDFTGAVTIVFQGGAPAYPLPAETASARIEKLASGAGYSHRLKFALRQNPPLVGGGAINTSLRVATGDCSFKPEAGPPISVAHVALPLRTINSWLGNSVVLGVIAALIWEVIRKRFFGWEAK